jgi:hypothetical protein
MKKTIFVNENVTRDARKAPKSVTYYIEGMIFNVLTDIEIFLIFFNVITMTRTQSNNINQMITITAEIFSIIN